VDTHTFIAAAYCRNPHLQTLWPRLFHRHYKQPYLGERLELPDGDFVDLCWAGNCTSTRPVVAVFHGLEGSIHSPYAGGIMQAIVNQGWRCVFMHFRGCSGEHNRLERGYHSGDTGDIAYLIATLRQRHPASPLFAVGYSLGGNALLKYLGESGSVSGLTAAAAVSVPFLLNRGADRLNTGFSRFYQWYLIRSMKRKILDKFRSRKVSFPIDQIARYNDFWSFDHNITAPVHGFASAEDYYRRSSCRQYLRSINTPTLILHARDDPFLPEDAIPATAELSSDIDLQLSDHGGHVGFIAGRNPLRPVFWLEHRIPEFIRGHL
jgi:hypothetical protein